MSFHMTSQQMISPSFSLHFLALAIIFFVALSSTNGVDDRYSTCFSLFTCGDLKNVGYPFWGDGRPQYCGHPQLVLQCIDNLNVSYPYLKFGPRDLSPYHVLSITVSEHNLTLKLQGAPETPCNSYGNELGEILELSKSVEKINLLYNCNKGIVPNNSNTSSDSVSCFQNLTRLQAYYVHNMSALGEYASCNSSEVPVFRNELNLYYKRNQTLSEVIKQGFEVNYEYSSDCVKCNSSGCICGSSSSSFACLCKPALLQRLIIVGSVSLAAGIGMLIVIVWCLRKRRPTRKFADFWKSEATIKDKNSSTTTNVEISGRPSIAATKSSQ